MIFQISVCIQKLFLIIVDLLMPFSKYVHQIAPKQNIIPNICFLKKEQSL